MTPDRPLSPLCGVCNDKGSYVDFDGEVHRCESEECVRARAVEALSRPVEDERPFRRISNPPILAPGVPLGLKLLEEDNLKDVLKDSYEFRIGGK
jgi:hypothetical protein